MGRRMGDSVNERVLADRDRGGRDENKTADTMFQGHYRYKAAGTVTYWDEGSWKAARAANNSTVCALCYRRIEQGALFERALFPAERGVYIQNYHLFCAAIRKSVGERDEFLSARRARVWAEDVGCARCQRHGSCAVVPFDCKKAVDRIRMLCRKETEDESGENDL